MPDDIEKVFMDMKPAYDNIAVPGYLDDYINNGIKKAKVANKKVIFKRFMAAAASIFILTGVFSIRVSPAFAAYVSTIPGLQHVVKLINYDKGLMSAAENNFTQHIGITDEHEGMALTIDDIIVDSDRMIIFYTLKNTGDHRYVNIGKADLVDERGEKITAFISMSHFIDKDMNEHPELKEKINVGFQSDYNIPDKVKLLVKLKETKESYAEYHLSTGKGNNEDRYKYLSSTWEIEIPIDKSKFENTKKTYQIDKEIEIEGQKIKFTNVTISPTRIGVSVEYNQNNTKKLFGFDDLKIVDESGEEWTGIINDSGTTIIDDFHKTFYLESSYFKESKSLYIKGSSIHALDKDKLDVKVDIENGKLLSAPDDNIVLDRIETSDDEYILIFLLRKHPELDKHKFYYVFSSDFKDSDGKVYNIGRSGSSSGTDRKGFDEEQIIYVPKKQYKNPLIFTIDNYPSRITKEFMIKIR